MAKQRPPLILVVLDGFGISPITDSNPVALAKTPVIDWLMANYPYGVLDASGVAVGLPWGEVGNSEVGHLNLGAGLVVYQNLPRINIAVDNGTFITNEAFVAAAEHVKKNNSSLHLVGIIGTGGVHGHSEHLKALLNFARSQKVKNVFIHCVMDGRDTSPQSGIEFIKDIQKTMKQTRTGTIASLCGRYYAMDRNTNWDRTQKAYDLLTQGKGSPSRDPIDTLKKSYANNGDDEMLEPLVITDRKGVPTATVNDNDAVIFWNFREDRARQLAQAIGEKKFNDFTREKTPSNIFFVTMTEYEEGSSAMPAFPPQHIQHPFGWLVAQKKMRQLRIAETEKYAHVTYFFNGGREEVYANEDRLLVPSPRIATYDLQPEMSAPEVAKKLVAEIKKKKYDFCLVNFANPDMVAHTGSLSATMKGIETVDECLGEIVEANRRVGGITVITADHGNAEIVVDPLTKGVDKEHSTSPVPLMLIDESRKKTKTSDEVHALKLAINPIGILADVAPTLCELISIEPHSDMTGRSLLNDLI